MKRFLLCLCTLALASCEPCLAATKYVIPTGGGSTAQCNGTVNQTLAAAQAAGCTVQPCNCAYQAPDACATMIADDVCSVAGGSYNNATIKPNNSGTSGHPITYLCRDYPTADCIVRSNTARVLDANARSYITVDGFTFDGGAPGSPGVRLGGTSSTGNALQNAKMVDSNATDTSTALVEVSSCTDCSMTNVRIDINYQTSNPVGRNYLLSVGGNGAVTRFVATNAVLQGWWNSRTVTNCTDCILDGVRQFGAKNHFSEYDSGVVNLIERNGYLGPSSGFMEQFQTRGTPAAKVNGFSFLNNYSVVGWLVPSDSHECSVTGTVKIRNNVFGQFSQNGTAGKPAGDINAGCSGCAESCTSPSITYDVGNNAYIGSNNLGSGSNALTWRDDRNVATGTGTQIQTAGFANWQSLTTSGSTVIAGTLDGNSIILGDTDYRAGSTPAPSTASVTFGATCAVWGAMTESDISGTGDGDGDGIVDGSQYFIVSAAWGSGILTGDIIEYDMDGTARQVTDSDVCNAVSPAAPNCQAFAGNSSYRRIKFTPPIDRNGNGTFDTGEKPGANNWWLAWGALDSDGDGTPLIAAGAPITDGNRFSCVPNGASALVDAGDDANCGHSIVGSGCDIGPSEQSGATQPTISITGPGAVTEGGTQTWTINLSAVRAGDISGTFSTSDGTAGGGSSCPSSDYVTRTAVAWTIPAGQTSTTLTTTTCDDATVESQETYSGAIAGFTCSTGCLFQIGATTATAAINDNDTGTVVTQNVDYGGTISGVIAPVTVGWTPRALGTVTAPVSSTCSTAATGYSCFKGFVSGCPNSVGGVIPEIEFELRLGNPTSVAIPLTERTIFTTAGLSGGGFVSDNSRSCLGGSNVGGSCTVNADCPSSTCGTQSFDMLETLRGPGTGNNARIIEMRWGGYCAGGSNARHGCFSNAECPSSTCVSGGWFGTDQADGMELLGCRHATLVDFISRFFQKGPALCLIGTSAGGQQLAMDLEWYGLEGEIDAGVAVSSPFGGRVDVQCDAGTASTFCSAPVTSCPSTSWGFPDAGSRLINQGDGLTPSDGRGDCCNAATSGGACRAIADPAATPLLQSQSPVFDHGDFDYGPNTPLHFVLGTGDTQSGAPYGSRLWQKALADAGMNPALLSTVDISGAPHDCLSWQTCDNDVLAWLQTNCVAHP